MLTLGSLKHHDWIIVGQVHSCGIGLFIWLGSLRKIVFISLLLVHLWAIMLLSFQQVHSSQRLIDSLSMIHLVFLGTIISQGSLFANSFNINIRGSLLIQLQYHNTRFTRKRRLIWISDSLYSWCFKEKIRCKKIYHRGPLNEIGVKHLHCMAVVFPSLWMLYRCVMCSAYPEVHI